eukprot:9015424-Pyramimonas_sp.AAC.1
MLLGGRLHNLVGAPNVVAPAGEDILEVPLRLVDHLFVWRGWLEIIDGARASRRLLPLLIWFHRLLGGIVVIAILA